MNEEIITIKRTKVEVTAEDLKKIEELTKRTKNFKKELIKLMEEKEEINKAMYELERSGYCDVEMFEGEVVDSYNTSPKFLEATKEYDEIMVDTKDFWLEYIDHIDED